MLVKRHNQASSETVSPQANATTNGEIPSENAKAADTVSVLGKQPPAGHKFLADLADVVRSKNSGPYELTFDVMFPNKQSRDMVKNANILTTENISSLYKVP